MNAFVRISTLALILGCFTAGDCPAATWIIQPNGSGDAPTIRAGIDSAAAGDSVVLAAGTFTGTGNRNLSFLGKAITVTSADGPEVTVIDCQSGTRGFVFSSGEGLSSVLSNITITNGASSTGGGIYCVGSSPTISGNVIDNNSASGSSGGAGIHCTGGSAPLIDSNLIKRNGATWSGGGIRCSGSSSPTISNNVFVGNNAIQGGAIGCFEGSAPVITGNTLNANRASVAGGIYCNAASPVVSHTIIAFGTQGGATSCVSGASPTWNCCVSFSNTGGNSLCGVDGGDNAVVDPQFCGVLGSGNFLLQSDSPCAPANSACGVQIGAKPVGCATVEAKTTTWGRIKVIFER